MLISFITQIISLPNNSISYPLAILASSKSCNDLSSTGNCSTYASYRVIIPIVTGLNTNVIDDIEFFYIGLASKMS